MSVIALEKADLSKLVEAAERGEEIVLTRDGRPAVRIGPAETPALTDDDVKDTPGKRLRGLLKGKVVIHDPEWWKPDDELADLFENSKLFPHDPDAP